MLTSVKKEKLPQKSVGTSTLPPMEMWGGVFVQAEFKNRPMGRAKRLVFLEAYVTHSLNKHSLKASPVPESPFNSLRNKAS